MIGELTNHLWQSTAVALLAGLLAVALRKNRAQVRYGLLLSASLKFFLPFSLLIGLGSRLEWSPADDSFAAQIATPSVSYAMEQITQPFPNGFPVPFESSTMPSSLADHVPLILFGIWVCGFGAIALVRLQAWRRIRTAVRASSSLETLSVRIQPRVQLRSCPGLLEPGVVGIWRPILLLPAGILKRLEPRQLEAVLAHELCHVRRRDNLTATLHMIVEAVFWFHPLVWWIGSRLVVERERACDEEVLRLGNEPQVYAEGILNICKWYQESPFVCMSGVTGSDLRKRVEEIMRNRVPRRLSLSGAVLLIVAAITVLAGPIATGVLASGAGRLRTEPLTQTVAALIPIGQERQGQQEQTATPDSGAGPQRLRDSQVPSRFEVASIRPSGPGPNVGPPSPFKGPADIAPCSGGQPQIDPRRFAVANRTLYSLIAMAHRMPCSHVYATQTLSGGPEWVVSERFDIQAVLPEGTSRYTWQQFLSGDAPQLQLMLQAFLADRFRLTLRRDVKELPVYELLWKNERRKFAPPNDNDRSPIRVNVHVDQNGHRYAELVADKATIADIANLLTGDVHRPVLDRTGIAEEFSFSVDYSLIGDSSSAVVRPSLRVAIEDELGLKLERSTASIEVWTIERVEKPTEN